MEPLQIDGGLVYRLSEPKYGVNVDEINVSMWDGYRKEEKRADGARRVMACMNACANLRTDLLEQGGGVFDILENVAAQRDELLAALKVAQRFCNSFSAEECPDSVAIPINEAIAKAEAK